MYDAILVPTDGSDSSTAAVEQAVAIAEGDATTVHFLHVIDVGTEMSAGASGSIAPQLTETLEDEAESALDEATSRAERAGVSHERVTREGDPHEVIAEYTAESGIDIVVMGASGQSGVKERLLGSTTDRVVRSVDTSVLIARP
ncbi:universal stress protein [Haloterrigena sp. SYSU A558-1]|uniref:Universal stress protein n=1 Tax=Haloterrigena gelatinilytica TaxID=2741724 RepID=A0A8J8GRA2_9EURY|nr:universal stress protein [Haloterrigena gelatinilytica]NUB92090.1 universal stress protein [Haloterrigena gelatinilytica]NUC72080.1 universal stress protein [Haloterrigena gelatinilytica]